jgi:hypothetical protein
MEKFTERVKQFILEGLKKHKIDRTPVGVMLHHACHNNGRFRQIDKDRCVYFCETATVPFVEALAYAILDDNLVVAYRIVVSEERVYAKQGKETVRRYREYKEKLGLY